MITVVSPGPHSLIQDLGRPGYYSMGLPPSGALDEYSHRCANILVGNAAHAASLEITMAGPELYFGRRSVIALTGGTAELWIGGELRPCWMTHEVRADETVHIGRLATGTRAYLAVRGGIATPPFLGSRSVYVPSRIGGLAGTALETGDVLEAGDDVAGPELGQGASIDSRLWPSFSSQQTIRVVEGLCNYRFTSESIRNFFDSRFVLTPLADRTGCRLQGPPLEFVDRIPPFGAGDDASNVVDLGYPVGSIQVPNGKEVICLLKDAVTGGGYATIGTVVSADIDVLAQMKAPDEVRFESVDLAASMRIRADRRRRLHQVNVNLNLLSLF